MISAEEFNNLILRIKLKDKVALGEICKLFCKSIKWIGYHVTGDWHYAEDIVTEVIIELWNKAYKFPFIELPDSWMYKFAKNKAIDFYRVNLKKHRGVISLDNLLAEPTPQDYIENNSDLVFLDILRVIDKTSREIVIMKVQFNFTFKEIAKHLKKPQGTVAWKYREALEKLKQIEKRKIK